MLVNRAAGDCLQLGSLDGGRKRAMVAEPIPVKVRIQWDMGHDLGADGMPQL